MIFVKKCVFNKHAQSRFVHLFLMMSWNLCASWATPDGALAFLEFRKQNTKQVAGPWGALSLLKKPFKGQRWGSCWQELQKIVLFTQVGVIDLPSRQINDLLQKGDKTNWVSGQTWCEQERFLKNIIWECPPRSLSGLRYLEKTLGGTVYNGAHKTWDWQVLEQSRDERNLLDQWKRTYTNLES